MIKKAVIAVLCMLVSFLYWQHHQAQKQLLAEHLIAAAYKGQTLEVKNLIEEGAPLEYTLYFNDEARNYKEAEFSPLHAAASGGNEDIINYLLDQKMDINQQNNQGWTPLFIAIRDGHFEAAKLLVFRKANLNLQTDTGTTPLVLALLPNTLPEKNRAAFVTYILGRGADLNTVNQFGHSALYYATVELQNPKLVEILLEHGADPLQADSEGQTVLQRAQQDKLPRSMVKLLQSAAKQQATQKEERAALKRKQEAAKKKSETEKLTVKKQEKTEKSMPSK